MEGINTQKGIGVWWIARPAHLSFPLGPLSLADSVQSLRIGVGNVYEDDTGWDGFVLSQVSESRPGAPMVVRIDATREQQILRPAYPTPTSVVDGAPSVRELRMTSLWGVGSSVA
jgi:hypothetical protein